MKLNSENRTPHWHILGSWTIRTIALRRSSGKWQHDPQTIYDLIRDHLKTKQVAIQDIFVCKDENVCLDDNLVIVQTFATIVLPIGFNMEPQNLRWTPASMLVVREFISPLRN